ncbi:MAG: cytochrome c [Alphaproteobacteria bacterium]|nr:cytochrome c [Alphaproteobacteria bacterium]
MIKRIAICLTFAATAALAHTGVKNPDVLARMEVMKGIADHTKLIVQMSRGVVPYDADQMKAAAAGIEASTAETIAKFEIRAEDPKSEALPSIWEDWQRFETLSLEMGQAAAGISDATSPAELALAAKALGETCAACHKAFRE